MKRGNDGNAFRYKFCGLLCGRTLPDAEGPRGTPTDGRSQRNGGVHENLCRPECGLDVLEHLSLDFKGNSKDDNCSGFARISVLSPRNVSASFFTQFGGGVGCALRVAGSDNDRFPDAPPAQCKPGTFRARPADNGNGHANPRASIVAFLCNPRPV
jgi:hypothetical protein